jgi:hypothetical protein
MKNLRAIFIIIIFFSLLTGIVVRKTTTFRLDERIYLEEIAPGIVFYEKKGLPPHYPSNSNIIAFNSYDVRPDIKGYAGPIKVLIAIDNTGTIRGIKILEHRETKNYVHYMERPEYLSQFIGKSVKDPLAIDKDIDAISRATVSVEALTRTVRESSRLVAATLFNIEVPQEVHEKRVGVDLFIYLSLFLSTLAFYLFTRKQKRLLKLRDVFLVLSFLVVGLYLSSPFSVLHLYNFILLRHSSSFLFYGLLLSLVFSIFVAGRFYCGWLCPFGALVEFIGRLPLRKWELPEKKDIIWRRLKYVFFLIITGLVLFTGVPEFGIYEAYVTLFSFHGNILQWTLVILMLFVSLKVKRFWCRFLCPAGAFLALFTPSTGGYRSSAECPQSNPPDPPPSECIRCNKCLRRD